VSLGDALDQLKKGKLASALKIIADRRNAKSVGAVIDNASIRSRLARVG
jgi:hypothetical protein